MTFWRRKLLNTEWLKRFSLLLCVARRDTGEHSDTTKPKEPWEKSKSSRNTPTDETILRSSPLLTLSKDGTQYGVVGRSYSIKDRVSLFANDEFEYAQPEDYIDDNWSIRALPPRSILTRPQTDWHDNQSKVDSGHFSWTDERANELASIQGVYLLQV
jgi:hypothetical protein